METLPVEIVELILVACEAKVLALSVPRVSKLFKNLSGDNSTVWKAKCEQKYLNSNSKPSDPTWKRYYFAELLKLFPLYGFTIAKTTHKELLAAPKAVEGKSGQTIYVVYKSHNFWVDRGVFNMMYLTKTSPLPIEWTEQGLYWQLSYVQMKELLKKKVGNYQVTLVPCQTKFRGEDCFTASISSVVKQGEGADALYYGLEFDFSYAKAESPVHFCKWT
eukprot:TRINITY_DN1317_c0_g2_i2.p1 TRINITY_DN1317_c0_g2~~TRINITY_DN1317_c0_g2_i2.p1  ORF type:complete len:240 (+),score=2.58 TRINITY_DN1317_c0_g2_i2:66-722(+)